MNPAKLIVDVAAEEDTAFLVKALPLTNAMGLLANQAAQGAGESERLESAVMDALLALWECEVGNASRASRQAMTVSALSTLIRLAGARKGPSVEAAHREAMLTAIGEHVTLWGIRLHVEAARPDNPTIVADHEREMRGDLAEWRAVEESHRLGLPLYVTKILWEVLDEHETKDSLTRGRLAMRWTVCLVAVLARAVMYDERIRRLEAMIDKAECEKRVLS
jgi:hypothetical protein